MARRRSARIASISKTPSKAGAYPNLSSLVERDESPEEHVTQSLDALVASPGPVPQTPADSTPPKPPMSEMHPSKVHFNTAPPSSGLRLGFTDIKPATRREDASGAPPDTPSKVGVPSSPFTFRFAREAATDVTLGPEARRMMDEIREEALKIKADLAAKRQLEKEAEEEVEGRKIATAKGRAGRYSAAHMAEFKKMDSIENHPSAFRAHGGRTPLPATGIKRTQSRANLQEPELLTVPKGIKRTQSKANLQDTEAPIAPKGIKRTQSKANLYDSDAAAAPKGIKRAQSKANLQEPETPRSKHDAMIRTVTTTTKVKTRTGDESPSPVKRVRQHIEDYASSARPVSRDGSFLPRPKSAGNGSSVLRSQSSLASLMVPTKSSLARATNSKIPGELSLLKSPSVSTLRGLYHSTAANSSTTSTASNNLTRSVTTNNLAPKPVEQNAEVRPATARTPSGRFEKVKSLLRGTRASAAKVSSAIPLPSGVSKTPAPSRVDKEFSVLPLTTPRHKPSRDLAFTPLAKKVAAVQNSPSPVKSGIHRSRTRPVLGEVYYPTLHEVMAEAGNDTSDVLYPDLSEQRPLNEPSVKQFNADTAGPSNFTFRSDHTIRFGSASPGFGSEPGKTGIRQVRPSMPTVAMPGSFPLSTMSCDNASPNKENESPRTVFKTVPHGMASKKRHRVSTDEEDAEQEAAQRAAKKRRQDTVPEGDALLAPKLTGASDMKLMASPSPRKLMSPGFASRTPSPTKKKTILSLSRLNMLARPKLRK